MNDTELPPLDADVLAMIDRASGIDPAPVAVRARLLGRVEAAIVGSGGGNGGGGGESAGPASVAHSEAAASGPGLSRFSMRAAAPLGASFVLGALTSAAVLIGTGIGRSPFRSEGSTAAPRAVATEIHPVGAEPVAVPSEVTSEPAIGAGSAAPLASESAAAQAPARAEAVPPRTQLAVERKLLDKARSALEEGEPAVALSATAQHERQFPSGALAQEREAMAIRALVALGRSGEARTRAARFRARYPDSLLLSTIDQMVDAASSR